MRIHAESRVGELRHVRAPDGNESRRAQSRYGGRIRFGAGLIPQDRRTCSRDVTGKVEQILDRYRDTREWRELGSVCTQPVATVGRSPRGIGMYFDEGALSLACGIGDSG